MDFQATVVLDKAQSSKLIQKEVDTWSSCAHHFSQRLLADLRNDRLEFRLFAEIRQQQENPRQPLLTGIEELVDQVLFDSNDSRKKIGGENLGKQGLLLKGQEHCPLLNTKD